MYSTISLLLFPLLSKFFSLFYLCMFRRILGLVALTVSEWSALSCLVAVTFVSLSSTLLSSTPDVSIPGLQEWLLFVCAFWVSVIVLFLHCSPTSS